MSPVPASTREALRMARRFRDPKKAKPSPPRKPPKRMRPGQGQLDLFADAPADEPEDEPVLTRGKNVIEGQLGLLGGEATVEGNGAHPWRHKLRDAP